MQKNLEILLPHKSNIERKIEKDYKEEKNFFRKFYNEKYLPWHKKNMQLTGTKKEDIYRRASWLSDYLDEVDYINHKGKPKGKKENWITFQSKFRSTVLEEFIYYLLKDCSAIRDLNLSFKNKGVFVGLSIDSRGKIVTKTKDVDCAIVREENIVIGGKKEKIAIPVVAIEVKTYVDKTMWGGAQYTAQLIKNGNPLSRVYLVAETNAVKLEELLPNSPVDEIFILRKDNSSEIDKKTVYEFFTEINKYLQQIKKPAIIRPPGKLLHPD